MKVGYVFTTSTTSPYIKCYKITDGVPEDFGAFPFAVPGTLKAIAISPNGNYIIAARASGAQGTQALRAWRMVEIDSFTEMPMPSLGTTSTVTVNELLWLTDTHVVAATTIGVFFGVFNPTTYEFAFTQLNSLNSPAVAKNSDGTHFITTGGSTPYYTMFQRTGDTAAQKTISGAGPGFASTLVRWSSDGKMVLFTNNSSGSYLRALAIDAAVTAFTIASITSDDLPNSLLVALVAAPDTAFQFFGANNTAPRIWGWRIVNGALVKTDTGGSGFTNPSAGSNKLAITPDGKTLLTAVPNTTHKLRGFLREKNNELLADSPYNNVWQSFGGITQDIAVTPYFDVDPPHKLYNSFAGSLPEANLSQLKLLLVSSSAVFNAAHTTLSQARGSAEVYGGGWPQGGVTLANVQMEVVSGNEYALIADIPPTPYNGTGNLTFRSAILYNDGDANDRPLAFFNFGTNQIVEPGRMLTFAGLSKRLFHFKPEA